MSLALDAVRTVHIEDGGRKEIDIKRYAKVEKIPGGDVEDSRVLKGVMLNKDVTHGKMRRKIHSAPHAATPPLTPPPSCGRWVAIWFCTFCFDQLYIKHVVDSVAVRSDWGWN